MKSHSDLQEQLHKLRLHFRILGKAEVSELRKILHHDEQIIECAYGYYQGGSGLLVATDSRLLLVDKRPFYLNLEDIAYERIRDIFLAPSWLQATLQLRAGHTKLTFRSLSDARLRRLKEYAKQRMLEAESKVAEVIHSLQPAMESPRQVRHPAWTPHQPIMQRRKPTKFYPLNGSVKLSQLSLE